MDWKKYKTLSNKWCELSKTVPETICRFEKKGNEKNICQIESRTDIAEDVLNVIKEANKNKEIEMLRQMFPPAHDAFLNQLERLKQHIGCVVLTRDGKILFRNGTAEDNGRLHLIDGENICTIENAKYAGISWDKEFIAIAYDYGIDVYQYEGTKIATYSLPDYWIGDKWLNSIISMTPFNDGQYVLVVSLGGIYVLAEDDVALIHPLDDEERYDMIHACVSPRDMFIAVGDQNSEHIILDVEEEFEVNKIIGCASSYAHYALYNRTGSRVLFNSCHMYDGESIIVGVDNDEVIDVEVSFKMTAGVSFDERFLVGTVEGNIICVNSVGTWDWCYYVGSPVTSMDVSADGKVLVVGTYAGNLHFLRLQFDELGKDVIGIEEEKRWLIWKDEKEIYRW